MKSAGKTLSSGKTTALVRTTSTVIADASPAPSAATPSAPSTSAAQSSTKASASSTYPLNGDWTEAAGAIALIARRARDTYNPTTGRFLSVDSVYGGNANPYVYPTNPIDNNDLTGASVATFFGFYSWLTHVDFAHISTTYAGYREASVHGWWTRGDVPLKYSKARVTVVLEEDLGGVWYKISSNTATISPGSGGNRATARVICTGYQKTKWRGYAFSYIPGLWGGGVDAKDSPTSIACRV